MYASICGLRSRAKDVLCRLSCMCIRNAAIVRIIVVACEVSTQPLPLPLFTTYLDDPTLSSGSAVRVIYHGRSPSAT
jgi:hypothetical protein